MRRQIVIGLVILLLLLSGCQGNITNLSKEKLDKDFDNIIRYTALELLEYKETILGFRMAGSNADNESADYIVDKMEEVGLTNIRKEEIELDGWKVDEALLTIFCDCTDGGKLDVRSIGYYPTNMSFNKAALKITDVSKGTELHYQNKDVSGNLVVLDTEENLLDNILRAKEKGALGVLVSSNLFTYLKTYPVEQLPTDFPVLSITNNTLAVIRKYVKEGSVDAELTANSVVSEGVKAYNVVGEIKGKNKNKVIYVTASRDSLYKGFFGSGVSIGELFVIAEELIQEGYKPNNTIRFVVTTGQKWGRIGRTFNEGIKAQLEVNPDWVEQAKAVIVLDGMKPIEGTVETEVQGSEVILPFLEDYNKRFLDLKDYAVINKVTLLDSRRATEASVWAEKGVPTILLSEPKVSKYLEIENTSGDVTSIKLDNGQLNFIVDYFMSIIKEIDKNKDI